MSNLLQKLIRPRLPSAAAGLTGESAAVVALDRRRDTLVVRRAGHVSLPDQLVRPNFDEANIADVNELADVLAELVTSAGLSKRRRWSVALPEAATRTSILTLETAPASRGELEEMLRWKTERSFGAPLAELRVARDRLCSDGQGRARYLATAVRLSVLAQYESVFDTLGWRAGLIVPRHMGEARWLMKERAALADALLVSAHQEGFTAVMLRRGQPFLLRNIICDAEDRADELYRFLLFYRDRMTALGNESEATAPDTIEQLLVAGDGIDRQQARAIIQETLAASPRLLGADDVRLSLPSSELSFDLIAAPAGLAALAWR